MAFCAKPCKLGTVSISEVSIMPLTSDGLVIACQDMGNRTYPLFWAFWHSLVGMEPT